MAKRGRRTKQKSERLSSLIQLIVTPEFKVVLAAEAAAESRTLSGHIRWLLERRFLLTSPRA